MLSSSESIKTSLAAIRNGEAGLNSHRKSLLDRVPNTGDWSAFRKNSITNKDIAYLSDTVLDPDGFAPYTGFTEEDVRKLCGEDDGLFENMKFWYNGYTLYTDEKERISVYNPNSVMKAARKGITYDKADKTKPHHCRIEK